MWKHDHLVEKFNKYFLEHKQIVQFTVSHYIWCHKQIIKLKLVLMNKSHPTEIIMVFDLLNFKWISVKTVNL